MSSGRKNRNDTDDFVHLFVNDVPLLDVRAEVEFGRGSFPSAVNIPLLNDAERAAVGTAYKQEGQEAAVRLGHSFVCGDVKAARLAQWQNFARQNPAGFLFCFRGGMRSHIVQEWLTEAGTPYPLVKGGYKAMRRFLIDTLDEIVLRRGFVIIGGRTGTGKTTILQELPGAVDLEGIARHRGSSFGRRLAPQPGQIDFENTLAIRLLKLDHGPAQKTLFIEDESHLVGICALPASLLARMKAWPLAVVEEDLESRISAVLKDYVTDMCAEHKAVYGEEGFDLFAEFLRASLFRIRNRLGLERHANILTALEEALRVQRESGDETLHRRWIADLLTLYYDPMYDYQLSRKNNPVVFRGSRADVTAWCRQQGEMT